jgi:acyl dehydratase
MHRGEYRVRAYNTALLTENKMHDDTVAKRFGFRGGLVPGVDVYAYLTQPIVARWGRSWLERGAASARFLHPVYDGEEVVVAASYDDRNAFDIEVRNSDARLCAAARAELPDTAPPPPDLSAYPLVALPAERPRASAESLVPGAALGSLMLGFHADRAPEYLADVRESLAIYREQRVAHPGYLLRNANFVLAANVTLGPWIHVGSQVQHFAVALDGDSISTRARITSVYEKKGHRFVELDVLMVADDVRPLQQVHHTAIYQPRQASST